MKNKVIKASAGTGKTFTLSIEYLNLLLNGADVETISVITFTRKATAEIRAKIFENIRKLLSEDKSESDMIIETLIKIDENNKKYEKNEIIEKIQKIYVELSSRKDKIKITTIDSFVNTIFSKFTAPEMNIYSYEIVDDDINREYIMKSFEAVIENRESFVKITNFLKKYAERDVEKYIEWIEFILNNRWLFAMLKEKPEAKEGTFEAVTVKYEKMTTYFYSISGVLELLENKGKSAIILKDFIEKIVPKFEDIKKRDYSIFFKKDSFWKKSAIKKADDGEYMMCTLYIEFKRALADYIYSSESIAIFNELEMLNKIIGDIYTEFKVCDRKFTHTDISYYTFLKVMEYEEKGKKLSKDGNYFYEIFENKIKYLLIDEFQDTSVIQWKILKPIIDSADKTICVGDEKQSIYAFRGGEKNLFTTLPKILNAEEKSLETSYRSYENVIKFVNDFFYGINDNWSYNRVNYLEDRKGGCVKCFLYDSKSETNCFEDMRDLIFSNGDYDKSAVLARTNTVLEEMSEILSNSKIPALKDSSLSLIEHRSVKPFYYLISFLSKNDFFDLLLFLRSDIIHISEKMMQMTIENKKNITEFILSGNIKLINKLNQELQNVLINIKKLKDETYENLTFMIMDIFNPLKIYDKLNDSKNCIKFVNLMKKFSDIHSLIKFINENRSSEQLKQEGTAENNGITLMTIHKSKGLEFETVYCHIKAGSKKRNGSNLNSYIKYGEDFSTVERLLFSNNLSDFAVEFFDEEIYNIEDKKEFDEWLNNLYVAFTRAKKNLYIFIEFNKGIDMIEKDINSFEAGNIYFTLKKGLEKSAEMSLSDIAVTGFSNGEYEKSNRMEMPEELKQEKRVDSEAIYKIVQREYVYEEIKESFSDFNSQYKQKIGVASHYYLSFIKTGIASEQKEALEMTMKKYGNMLGKSEVISISRRLNKFIDKKSEYFDKKYKIVNEFSIFDKVENREYRIDKLIIDENEKKCIIIDFKSGITRDESQLDKYKELILKLLPDYKVKTVFESI